MRLLEGALTPLQTLQEIINLLVGGIIDFGKGIGNGISSIVSSMMYTADGATLSPYFVAIVIFASIAICTGLTSKLFMWLGNLGK